MSFGVVTESPENPEFAFVMGREVPPLIEKVIVEVPDGKLKLKGLPASSKIKIGLLGQADVIV
jgi:hypothetical protein